MVCLGGLTLRTPQTPNQDIPIYISFSLLQKIRTFWGFDSPYTPFGDVDLLVHIVFIPLLFRRRFGQIRTKNGMLSRSSPPESINIRTNLGRNTHFAAPVGVNCSQHLYFSKSKLHYNPPFEIISKEFFLPKSGSLTIHIYLSTILLSQTPHWYTPPFVLELFSEG
jgi:hypothetical protein